MWSMKWTVTCLVISGVRACGTGVYGDSCNLNCSELCLPGKMSKPDCYKDTGICIHGCYKGPNFDPFICDGTSKLLQQYVIFGTTVMSTFVLFIVFGIIFWYHRHQHGSDNQRMLGRRDLYNSVVSQVEDNIYSMSGEQTDMPKVLDDEYLLPNERVQLGEYITPVGDQERQNDCITPNYKDNSLNSRQIGGAKANAGHWSGFQFNNHDHLPAPNTPTNPMMPNRQLNSPPCIKATEPPWEAIPRRPATPPVPNSPSQPIMPTRLVTPTLPPVNPAAKPGTSIKPWIPAKPAKVPSLPVPCLRRFVALINENNEERAEHPAVPHRSPIVPKKLIGRDVFLRAEDDKPAAVPWSTWNNGKAIAEDRPLETEPRWNAAEGLSRHQPNRQQGRDPIVVSEHLYDYCV